MSNNKQNKTLARCIVTLGTLTACLGIWTSVVNNSNASQYVATAPLNTAAASDTSPVFSDTSISGIQQGQTGQVALSPATVNQTIFPAQPSLASTMPSALTPAQPTPTTTAPVVTPVNPTPAKTTTPRLVTKGS